MNGREPQSEEHRDQIGEGEDGVRLGFSKRCRFFDHE
jgi:hypothetical protein